MKRDKKRPSPGRKKNLLKAIGVLAIGASASLAHLPDAQAYQVAISSGDEATLEQFLRDHPTSLYAPDVIGRLSLGVPKTDTALPEMILAKNNGNGGGKGNGNGGGHGNGGGNGHGGGNGNGGGGNSGGGNSGNGGGNAGGNAGGGNSGSGGADTDGDASGADGQDSGSNGLGGSNGGHGRFHGADDTGRPDMFGDHGQPDIGPPGQSGY